MIFATSWTGNGHLSRVYKFTPVLIQFYLAQSVVFCVVLCRLLSVCPYSFDYYLIYLSYYGYLLPMTLELSNFHILYFCLESSGHWMEHIFHYIFIWHCVIYMLCLCTFYLFFFNLGEWNVGSWDIVMVYYKLKKGT